MKNERNKIVSNSNFEVSIQRMKKETFKFLKNHESYFNF